MHPRPLRLHADWVWSLNFELQTRTLLFVSRPGLLKSDLVIMGKLTQDAEGIGVRGRVEAAASSYQQKSIKKETILSGKRGK
mgnify:CR=1 FL=1